MNRVVKYTILKMPNESEILMSYYDAQQLSYLDLIYVSIYPTLSFIAVILNLISAFIFSRNEFKQQTIYSYLKMNSIFDALYLFSISLFPISILFQHHFSMLYWLRVYELYICIYGGRVFNMITTIISIAVSFDRFLYLKGHSQTKCMFNGVILLAIVISMTYGIPTLLSKDIIMIKSNLTYFGFNETISTAYSLSTSKFGKDRKTQKVIGLISYGIRISGICIMILLNSFFVYQIRSRLNATDANMEVLLDNRKSTRTVHINADSEDDYRLQSSYFRTNSNRRRLSSRRSTCLKRIQKSQINSTQMVVWLSLVFIVDQISILIAYTLYVRMNPKSEQFKTLTLLSHATQLCCHCSNIFVYNVYCKRFSLKLKDHLRYFFCRKTE